MILFPLAGRAFASVVVVAFCLSQLKKAKRVNRPA
jgi:hypothetical protein